MPEISRFLGIVISMYYKEHGPPHFHAVYGDDEVQVEMKSGMVHGNFPPRALAHVREWTAVHQAELLENWDRARAGGVLRRIAPLE